MALNEQGQNIETSPDTIQSIGSIQSNNSSKDFKQKGCVAMFIFLLVPAFLTLGIINSCGIMGEDYSARNIKLLRYHTVDFDWENRKYIYLDWYVLKGDDCYYVYYSDFPDCYSEMQWKRMAELPEYLSSASRKVRLGIAPIIEELPYTLIPLAILPDSIQANVKEQLKQKYDLPDPNDYDEQIRIRDQSEPSDDQGGGGGGK